MARETVGVPLGQVLPPLPLPLLLYWHQTSVHPDGVAGAAARTEIAAISRSPLTTPVGLVMVSVELVVRPNIRPRATMGWFAVMLPPPPPPVAYVVNSLGLNST